MAVQYRCRSCNAQRTVELGCEPDKAEFYASFIRCPACMRSDRTNQALYWLMLAGKGLLLAGAVALAAITMTAFLWILVPVVVVALWADHRRFLRSLDLAMIGAQVKGGPAGERLPRPFS